MRRETLTKRLKTLWAAHHFVYVSKDVADIAAAINVSPEKVEKMMRGANWDEALAFWNYKLPIGDLNLAKSVWRELIKKGEHINLVEYPEKPIKSALTGDPDVFALLNSHLFCVDSLCDEQIRARLAEERKFESPPVRYDGQHLPLHFYRWWLYPNWDDGVFSKVLARVNIFGDLVVGSGEDASLVIIRHGRLSLTRQFCDDVVNVSDSRLLVCL